MLILPDISVSRTVIAYKKYSGFVRYGSQTFLRAASLVPVTLRLERNRSFVCLSVPN